MTTVKKLILLLINLAISSHLFAGNGKLLETAGVTQIEGSGGGGLVPWAVLSGYDTREQWSVNAYSTRVSLDDFRLDAFGASVSLFDRFEFSVAEHIFDLKSVPFGEREIKQNIIGAKYKVGGDFLYSPYPQVAVGIQHKTLEDELIAAALGAEDSNSGTDYYVAISKAHLAVLGGYNAFWNITVRATKANQFGLLGFGGDDNDNYEAMLEGSMGALLSRHIAIGIEYRQKPNNFSAVEEDDAYDVFVAYLPNKSFNLTAAWVDLGTIAGSDDQQGFYVSLTGYLK